MASGLDSLKTTGQRTRRALISSPFVGILQDNYPYFSKERVWAGVFFYFSSFPFHPSHILQIHDISYLKEQETGYKWQNAIPSGQKVHGDTPLPSFGAARYVFANVHAIFALLTYKETRRLGNLFYFLYCAQWCSDTIPCSVRLSHLSYLMSCSRSLSLSVLAMSIWQ